MGLQGFTRVYRGLHGFKEVHKSIQGLTWVCKRLHGLKRVYKGVVTGEFNVPLPRSNYCKKSFTDDDNADKGCFFARAF